MTSSSDHSWRRRRGWAVSAVAVALSAAVAGCQPRQTSHADGPSTGSRQSSTLTVGGETRTFHLFVPSGVADAAAVPLVVVLHGGFGSGAQAEKSYGWDAKADEEGFVVAYPDGLNKAWAVGGGCCGRPGAAGVDDVGFVVAMVDDIAGSLPVDRSRVFATGISNGGLLAYRLACDTTLLAAVGPDSATQLGPCPSPARTSVLHIHGTADTRIRLDGQKGDGVASIDGPPVDTVLDFWRRVDDCGEPSTTSDGSVTTSVASCPDGRAVGLITIDGAGHQWPGGDYSARQRLLGLDEPSQALSATDVLWEFFAAHPGPVSS